MIAWVELLIKYYYSVAPYTTLVYCTVYVS
jgi:hypothetical protein